MAVDALNLVARVVAIRRGCRQLSPGEWYRSMTRPRLTIAGALAVLTYPSVPFRPTIAMAQLTLLVLRCQDLQLSRRFYSALGLTLTAEKHGTGPVHYSCRLGTTVLELYAASATPSSVRLGLGVADVGAAVTSVRSLGGRVDREPTGDGTTAMVRDPDGNRIELSPHYP